MNKSIDTWQYFNKRFNCSFYYITFITFAQRHPMVQVLWWRIRPFFHRPVTLTSISSPTSYNWFRWYVTFVHNSSGNQSVNTTMVDIATKTKRYEQLYSVTTSPTANLLNISTSCCSSCFNNFTTWKDLAIFRSTSWILASNSLTYETLQCYVRNDIQILKLETHEHLQILPKSTFNYISSFNSNNFFFASYVLSHAYELRRRF